MRPWRILCYLVCLSAVAGCEGSTFESDCCVVISTIEVSPPAAELAVGDSIQFTAEVRDQDNAVVTVPVDWSLSSTAAGSMSAQGMFKAASAGTVYVRGVLGTVRDSSLVTINP